MNSSDEYCDTRADGECVSEDPRCMHQPPERDVYHEYKDDSNDPELARMQRDAYIHATKILTVSTAVSKLERAYNLLIVGEGDKAEVAVLISEAMNVLSTPSPREPVGYVSRHGLECLASGECEQINLKAEPQNAGYPAPSHWRYNVPLYPLAAPRDESESEPTQLVRDTTGCPEAPAEPCEWSWYVKGHTDDSPDMYCIQCGRVAVIALVHPQAPEGEKP